MYKALPTSLTTVTRFSKIVALALFVLLPFGTFFLGRMTVPQQQQSQQTVVTQPTQAIRVQNKTYTNTKYGFSFEYPSNLTPRKDSTPEFIGFLENPDENQSQKLIVTVADNPQNLGLEEFVKKNKPIPYDWTDKSFEKKTVRDYEVLVKRAERPCMGICENTPLEKSFVIYLKSDMYIVSFSIGKRTSISDTQPDENWLDPILSSFNPAAPADFAKVYQGRGFELTIPNNYNIEDTAQNTWVSFKEKTTPNEGKSILVTSHSTDIQDPCTKDQGGYPNAQCTNINGYRTLDWGTEKPPYPMGPLEYRYSFVNKGVLYEIQFLSFDESEKNQILSTFKFTN